MSDLLGFLLGPLVIPECRRAGARGWLILVRTITCALVACIALACWWWWWYAASTDPAYTPRDVIPTALLILEFLGIAAISLLTPALLAGSLAGDKERGSLGLLLTTRVNSLEIVLGRLAGKLSQLILIGLVALPFFLAFATPADLGPLEILALIAVPTCFALAIGALSLAVSAVSRKGRSALLGIYALIAILLIGSALFMSNVKPGSSLRTLFLVCNPFAVLAVLFENLFGGLVPDLHEVWTACLLWILVALLAMLFAAWRLRPATLKALSGDSRKSGRRGWVPLMDEERPMLWKELFIERAAALGWMGRILGALLLAFLVLGPITLGCLYLYYRFSQNDPSSADEALALLGRIYHDSSFVLIRLLVVAIGLRAAISISSERERNTWDSILTSPLEGPEIVRGKLWGSLYSLRWLLVAALFAWTTALLVGGERIPEFIGKFALTSGMACFITAVGVRASLASGSSTKAIAITIGSWLVADVAIFVGSLILVGISALLFLLISLSISGLMTARPRPFTGFPLNFMECVTLVRAAAFYLFTLVILSESRMRFDQVAGRMAGDDLQVAADRMRKAGRSPLSQAEASSLAATPAQITSLAQTALQPAKSSDDPAVTSFPAHNG